MRRPKKRLLPLQDLLIIGIIAAQGAFWWHPQIRSMIMPDNTGQESVIISYTLLFIAILIPLKIIVHSFRKRSGVPAEPAARMARLTLVSFIFLGHLLFLLQGSTPTQSLKSLVEQSQETENPKETGYEEEDRDKLETLIETGEEP